MLAVVKLVGRIRKVLERAKRVFVAPGARAGTGI
jgi:hypothetical protein